MTHKTLYMSLDIHKKINVKSHIASFNFHFMHHFETAYFVKISTYKHLIGKFTLFQIPNDAIVLFTKFPKSKNTTFINGKID